MDFYMPPGINGDEAALEIRKVEKSSYIVWHTNQKDGEFNFSHASKVFDGFYEKPMTFDDLHELIDIANVDKA